MTFIPLNPKVLTDEPEPYVAPVATAIVTKRRSTPYKDVTAITPAGDPNVTVRPLSVLTRLAIRFCKVYLSTVIVLLFAGALSLNPTAPADAWPKLVYAFTYALFPAVGSLLMNASILLTKMDESYPSVMG